MTILSQNTDTIMDSVFVGYLATPARVLRELVTRDPGFMLRNMLRDTLSAWVTSGQNYVPIIGSLQGAVDALLGKEAGTALRTGGVSGGYDFAGTPQDMSKAGLKQKAPKEWRKKLLVPSKKYGTQRPCLPTPLNLRQELQFTKECWKERATKLRLYSRLWKFLTLTGGGQAQRYVC